MRTPAREPSGRAWIIASTALVLLLGIAIVPSTRHWVQTRLGSNRPLVATFKPLGVGPRVNLGRPYPPNDAWARFLPSPSDCPRSTTAPLAEATAENSMICVLNYARMREGLSALPVSSQLQQATRFRENLFRPGWTEQGIAVVVAKRFKGESDVAIWVSEFGERR
jgi:hypothetical protein